AAKNATAGTTTGDTAAAPEEIQLHWHGEAPPNETRTWLMQDLIPEVGSGLVSGQWGTFKTFVTIDLAHAVMTGESFLGFNNGRRGGGLFIGQEGANEVAIRLQGIVETRARVGNGSRAPFCWIDRCPPLIETDAAASITALAKRVADHLKSEFDLPLALI